MYSKAIIASIDATQKRIDYMMIDFTQAVINDDRLH